MSKDPDWDLGEIFESVKFGKLWVIVRFNGHWMFCARVRRKKDQGMYIRKDQIQKFSRIYGLQVGDMMFKDAHGIFTPLRPHTELAAQIAAGLERL